ncbi:class I SAM-dependent methyltransferase [Candidatus Parcubacteria bacterium]|nr:class I SAM-dependent methyltransferase [Patescibacteria group bacterium]MCG2689556.1 class I SAM-dependent methyltransferase [Candidatus Parcubacteria bacterium]
MHIPKNTIDKALQIIRTQIKPNGIGFISLKAGADEREDSETGRWFSYYSLKEFKKLLEKNGFEVIKQKTRKGERDWWLCYWVKTKANV